MLLSSQPGHTTSFMPHDFTIDFLSFVYIVRSSVVVQVQEDRDGQAFERNSRAYGAGDADVYYGITDRVVSSTTVIVRQLPIDCAISFSIKYSACLRRVFESTRPHLEAQRVSQPDIHALGHDPSSARGLPISKWMMILNSIHSDKVSYVREHFISWPACTLRREFVHR